jgi:hypothetical protein
MQSPIMHPRITVSRRRLVLIIDRRESTPGSVSATLKLQLGDTANTNRADDLLRTPPIRALMDAKEDRCLENSSRVAYACLQKISAT